MPLFRTANLALAGLKPTWDVVCLLCSVGAVHQQGRFQQTAVWPGGTAVAGTLSVAVTWQLHRQLLLLHPTHSLQQLEQEAYCSCCSDYSGEQGNASCNAHADFITAVMHCSTYIVKFTGACAYVVRQACVDFCDDSGMTGLLHGATCSHTPAIDSNTTWLAYGDH